MMLSVSSPPWVSRILKGEAVSMGYGFENIDATTLIEDKDTQDRPSKNIPTTSASSVGSGERWVLFRMNIEIPDCKDAKVITVYHGDVANEVSAQFCREHSLDESFVPVLQGAIQQQMDCTASA